MFRISQIDRGRFSIALFLLLFAQTAAAHGVLHFVNGRWYDGSQFVEREFYSVDGVLRDSAHGQDAEVVDLDGAYVVPGYGNAHTHGIGNDDYEAESSQFLARGVFYVANPNSIRSRTAVARETAGAPENVDARFANGGLTSSGGHPIQIFEKDAQSNTMDGDAYHVIDDLRQLEQVWPAILAGQPDFLKIYLERSEHHEARKNDPSFFGKRGLDPKLVAPIVQRANAAGLRVAAHVTSRHDFRVAVEAGVHEIAHLPLEPLEQQDAELAAERGTVVVTTALSHRPSDGVADLDALHRANLALLRDARVRMVLGTDSQATVIDEVHRIASLGVLENRELLGMLVRDTPQWIFPERAIGTLSDGAEASLLALSENPLADLEALTHVAVALKSGHLIDLSKNQAQGKPGIGQQLVHHIMSQGVEAAIAEYHRLRAEEPDAWDFGEGQLNGLGYAMMQHGKHAEATAIFQLNCEQYPESSNVWDSLAESFMERGDTEAAVENYERALAIDPANENAAAKLEELRSH